MSGPRWPVVVEQLLELLPALPGWDDVLVFDTTAVTTSTPGKYAVAVRGGDTTGTYTRSVAPSGLISEVGAARLLVGARAGDTDPQRVRDEGFALAAALEEALFADTTLGGVLGTLGTVAVSVEVQQATGSGSALSLFITLNYSSLT